MLNTENFKISHGLDLSPPIGAIQIDEIPTHWAVKNLPLVNIYLAAMNSENVMTAREHARQMQTSENRAMV